MNNPSLQVKTNLVRGDFLWIKISKTIPKTIKTRIMKIIKIKISRKIRTNKINLNIKRGA